MAYSLKRMWAAMAVTLVAASGLVSANNVYDTSSSCCWPSNTCAPCGDWAFSVEGLVFKTCVDGALNYGTQIHSYQLNPGVVQNYIEGKVKEIKPGWDWGFRLGAGYSLPCDCWGLTVYWTHFHAHARAHHEKSFVGGPLATAQSNFYFTPAWGRSDYNSSASNGIDETEARWKLNLDLLDIELGRPFCISQCLTLRPHIGVRAGWINQSFNIDNFVNPALGTGDILLLQGVHMSSKFTGAGLRGGLDTQWDLGCGMSLYGQGAASVLWGNFENKSKDVYANNVALTEQPRFYPLQKDDYCSCRAIMDAALGLRWRTSFCCDSIAMTLQVGWESHFFFTQTQFEDFVALSEDPTFQPTQGEVKNPHVTRNNLCLQGVAFGARFDF